MFNWEKNRWEAIFGAFDAETCQDDILKVPKNRPWGNVLGRVKEVAPFDAFIIEIWTVYCYVILEWT